jgi:hypothetical protein
MSPIVFLVFAPVVVLGAAFMSLLLGAAKASGRLPGGAETGSRRVTFW